MSIVMDTCCFGVILSTPLQAFVKTHFNLNREYLTLCTLWDSLFRDTVIAAIILELYMLQGVLF